MFPPGLVITLFVVMFVAFGNQGVADILGNVRRFLLYAALATLTSIYCFTGGIVLIFELPSPFVWPPQHNVVMALIAFWPYALTVVSGAVLYYSLKYWWLFYQAWHQTDTE